MTEKGTRYLFSPFLLLMASVTTAQAADTMDLEASYQAALRYATVVKLSQAQLQEAENRYQEALGASMPRINLRGSEFFQADPGVSGTGVPNTFVRTERPEASVNVTLPSFRGFKEIQVLKGANLETDRRRALEREARRLLFQDTMQAYFTAVKAEQDLLIIEKLIGVLRERLNELGRRVKLGKSRQSELLAQETDFYFLEAGRINQNSVKKAAYQLLTLLNGLTPQPQVKLVEESPAAPQEMATYLASGGNRADVVAARLQWMISREVRDTARTEFLPYFDAEANYYLYRVGFQEQVDWDANLKLTLPIFNWETVGAARVASSQMTQSELNSIESTRQVDYDVRTSYQRFLSSRERFGKYDIAATKAAKSYQLQLDEYRRGLIANLEVMQSQRTWLEALRSRNESLIDSWTNQYLLEIQAGRLPNEAAEVSRQ